MKTYIALFRGINVGGNNSLPMKELRALLEKLDAENVKTYIQSGNMVFQHATEDVDQLAERISAAIKESHGFAPRVLLLDVAAFSNDAISSSSTRGAKPWLSFMAALMRSAS